MKFSCDESQKAVELLVTVIGSRVCLINLFDIYEDPDRHISLWHLQNAVTRTDLVSNEK